MTFGERQLLYFHHLLTCRQEVCFLQQLKNQSSQDLYNLLWCLLTCWDALKELRHSHNLLQFCPTATKTLRTSFALLISVLAPIYACVGSSMIAFAPILPIYTFYIILMCILSYFIFYYLTFFIKIYLILKLLLRICYA